MSEDVRPQRFIETDATSFVFDDDDQPEEFANEEPPVGPAPKQVALAGADGQSAAKLLRQAKEEGAAALGKPSATR